MKFISFISEFIRFSYNFLVKVLEFLISERDMHPLHHRSIVKLWPIDQRAYNISRPHTPNFIAPTNVPSKFNKAHRKSEFSLNNQSLGIISFAAYFFSYSVKTN